MDGPRVKEGITTVGATCQGRKGGSEQLNCHPLYPVISYGKGMGQAFY